MMMKKLLNLLGKPLLGIALSFNAYAAEKIPANQEKTNFERLIERAEKGEGQAQLDVGLFYAEIQDNNNAQKWIEQAAQNNLPEAAYYLGERYYRKKEYSNAVKWLEKAAKGDIPIAQLMLGELYEKGLGVEKNLQTAQHWFEESVSRDPSYKATWKLAILALDKKDYANAFKWSKLSAEKGYPNAQAVLANLYDLGRGVKRNSKEAIKWLEKAAEQNLSEAQTILGLRYYEGKDVERDVKQAAKWFERAAEKEDGNAQFMMGLLYFNGNGVKKDQNVAVNWWRKSVLHNNPLAANRLAGLYEKGIVVKRNKVEAKRLYLMACLGKVEESCASLVRFAPESEEDTRGDLPKKVEEKAVK